MTMTMIIKKIIISDLDKTCRLCLSEENGRVPISHNADKISATLDLKVSMDDDLPKQTCTVCSERINEWYSYKLACHNSDLILQQCINFIKNKLSQNSPVKNCEDTLSVLLKSGESELENYDLIQSPSVVGDKYDDENSGSNNLVREESEKDGFGGLSPTALTSEEIKKHLSCQVCGKKFSRYNNRMTHEKKYHQVKNTSSAKKQEDQLGEEAVPVEYACKFCPIKLNRLDNLRTHEVLIHTKERPFSCECGTGFVRKHDLIWHQKTHIKSRVGIIPRRRGETPKSSIKCSLCLIPLRNIEKFTDHIKLTHLDDTFKCAICLSSFFSQDELVWHQLHPDKKGNRSIIPALDPSKDCSFYCNICNHDFSDINIAKSHVVRVHSLCSSSQNACCYQQLKNTVILASEKVSKDTDCDGVERNDLVLTRNPQPDKRLSEEHSYVSKRSNYKQSLSYVCSYCGKAFKSLGLVNKHEKLHQNQKPYSCKDCGKGFNQRTSFKLHALIHEGIKPHTCNVCHLNFRNSSNLNMHMKRHTSNPHNVCKICGKKFLSFSGFKRHLILHSGLKNFTCNLCNKVFFTQSEKNRHMKYHNKHKPHTCQYCNRSFYETVQLRRHLCKCKTKPPAKEELELEWSGANNSSDEELQA